MITNWIFSPATACCYNSSKSAHVKVSDQVYFGDDRIASHWTVHEIFTAITKFLLKFLFQQFVLNQNNKIYCFTNENCCWNHIRSFLVGQVYFPVLTPASLWGEPTLIVDPPLCYTGNRDGSKKKKSCSGKHQDSWWTSTIYEQFEANMCTTLQTLNSKPSRSLGLSLKNYSRVKTLDVYKYWVITAKVVDCNQFTMIHL